MTDFYKDTAKIPFEEAEKIMIRHFGGIHEYVMFMMSRFPDGYSYENSMEDVIARQTAWDANTIEYKGKE